MNTENSDLDDASGGPPDADDLAKPSSPREITRATWTYVGRRSVREFMTDQCMDLAAALTYRAVLAAAPALLVLVALIGLLGDPQPAVARVASYARELGTPEAIVTIATDLVESVTAAQGAGLALVTGLAIALWSASGYVAAFSRAMNRIYGVDEGRPIWRLRAEMLAVTVVVLLIAVVVVAALVLTGPVARTVGGLFGVSAEAVAIWDVAKWPVVVVLFAVIIAILYYWSPNVHPPKFRWRTAGSLVAIIGWGLGTAGFGFYVSNFGSYNETYGALGGVIVFLLWLWLTNSVLLFGAEVDAELERGRQLQGGIAAEEQLQLPHRDTSKIEKDQEKLAEDVARGRELRRTRGGQVDAPDED